jgi:hypothetical protein
LISRFTDVIVIPPPISPLVTIADVDRAVTKVTKVEMLMMIIVCPGDKMRCKYKHVRTFSVFKISRCTILTDASKSYHPRYAEEKHYTPNV